MALVDTIGSRVVVMSITWQVIILSFYTVFVSTLRALYAGYTFNYINTILPRHPPYSNSLRCILRSAVRLFCKTLFYSLRLLDPATPAVFMMCHTTLFVSAVDNAYAALTVYIFSLLLPNIVLKRLWETTEYLRARSQTDEHRSNQRWILMALQALPIGFLLFLVFLLPIPRLYVPKDLRQALNATLLDSESSYWWNPSSVKLFTAALVLAFPKRISKHFLGALALIPILTGYFLIMTKWQVNVDGERGSAAYGYTSAMDFVTNEWEGTLLLHIAVVSSSISMVFNPLWKLTFDVNLEDDVEEDVLP